MKTLVLLLTMLMSLSVYAQGGNGRAIKHLAKDIASTAKNFTAYNHLTREEKRVLRQSLKDVKDIMYSLGMSDNSSLVPAPRPPSNGPVNQSKYYCEGRALKYLSSGNVNRYASDHQSCLNIIEAYKYGEKYYCEGRALKYTSSGNVNRYASDGSSCLNVIRALNYNSKYYCEGRALKYTSSGNVNRYAADAQSCDNVMRAFETGKKYYCEGRALKYTSSGNVNRYAADAYTCKSIARQLN